MILKKHRKNPRALKLGMIEACLDSKGYLNHSDIAQVFGNHVKDAARVVREYKFNYPDTIIKQGNNLIPTEHYRRQILKKETNADDFIELLCTLHGSELR